MPIKSVVEEAEGGELIVQFALLDGVNWHFQTGTLRSADGRALASYPSQSEAARQLGSALRPALSRLKAVLDRIRQQNPAALTAEAGLQRMSLSYLVGRYSVHDELGAVICHWRNPELQQASAAAFIPSQRAAG